MLRMMTMMMGFLEALSMSGDINPPCCRDTLSQISCQRLQKQNSTGFGHRCNTDVEFRLIQCCSSCNRFPGAINYDRIAEALVNENCLDRYGSLFCQRFVFFVSDVFPFFRFTNVSSAESPCSGTSAYMGFRVCRRSCRFCDFSLVKYTLQNALDACRLSESFE